MHCAEKYLGNIYENERKKFREWCKKLLEAHTKTDYRFWADKIQGFAKEHGFEGWWKWWAPRNPHLVPAICGFGIPKMNMAETGQSKLANQQCHKLWLSEATTVDVVVHIPSRTVQQVSQQQRKNYGPWPNTETKKCPSVC